MTISSFIRSSCYGRRRAELANLALPHPRQATLVCQQDPPLEYPRQLALFRPFRKGRRGHMRLCRGATKRWPIEAEIGYAEPCEGKRVTRMAEEKKEPVTIKKYANRRLY